MNRALLVAQREFLENVRTKGFWIGILMLPIMLLMVTTIPFVVESTREAKRFAVIDNTGWLLASVATQLEAASGKFVLVNLGTNSPDALNAALRDGRLFAYFVIDEAAVATAQGSRYVSNNLTDRDLRNWFSGLVSQPVRKQRLAQENVSEAVATWINSPFEFETVQLGNDGAVAEVEATDIVRQWTPVAFVYLLWISVLINTQMLLTNTIEEKSNKLIEVLLSSVSPLTLMAGKIAGIAATGLAIIFSWALMALGFFMVLPDLLGFKLPLDIGAVAAEPWFLASFLVYFLLGYLLYAAILVGLGSICSNLKEAQNLMLPVQLIQMIPLFVMVPIGRDPNGTLAQVLSYFPPLTPFVMMNRAAAPPTTTEYVVTTLLLLVSIAVALWLAAKVFRVGILLTGKPPSLLEVIRWLRAPVANLPS